MTDGLTAQITAFLAEIPSERGGVPMSEVAHVGGANLVDGTASVVLEVADADLAQRLEPARLLLEGRIQALPDVSRAMVMLTGPSAAPSGPDPVPRPREQPRAQGGTTMHASPEPRRQLAPDVRFLVAVASGKGGVGKSTTAVNLAVALSRLGHKVGILDADIYGPSLPRMLGVSGKPTTDDGKTLEPKEAFGLKMMSIGLLVEEDRAMIWRGPMVQSALTQMLRDVNWGALDVLVVDMPPGTGDAQLTMAQQVPLAGAVIVSTPQDIALIDARKGIGMFQQTNVPILGLVENMSYHVCRNCGHREDVFGHGGAREHAEESGVPFLGELPLDLQIRLTSDAGTPITSEDPDGAHAAAYRAIAQNVWDQLIGRPSREPPRIRMI